MTRTQRDLIAALYNKRMKTDYETAHRYAAQFKKYDNLRMSEIDEAIEHLKTLPR